MKNNTKQQAQNLYTQTQLSKTEIANLLQISRRTLYTWVNCENWQRLIQATNLLPTMIAENIYYLLSHQIEIFLSTQRDPAPLSKHEVDTLHKLVLTIDKLKNRSTINENMETFAHFVDALKLKDKNLANQIIPYINKHFSKEVKTGIGNLMPPNFTENGYLLPPKPLNADEIYLDSIDKFNTNPDFTHVQKGEFMPYPTTTT